MDEKRRNELRTLLDRTHAAIIGRGMIIDITAAVEDLLTSIIAWCFSPTYDELDGEVDSLLSPMARGLKSIVLRKLDFSEKSGLFKECVQFAREGIYKSNSRMIKEILKNLDKVRKFRNLLAHSPMDSSKEYAEQLLSQLTLDSDSFQVLEYKKGETHKRNVNSGELIEGIERASLTAHQLLWLWALLRNRPEEASQHEIMITMTRDEKSQVIKRMGIVSSP